ncbi:OsmC family protein [bacterium]|nr:OsmC family protein [bacterium]
MPVRKSSAEWQGNLKEGKGQMKLGSGYFEGAYSFGSRFEKVQGTNPEELIGAAHAGCFSMALAHELDQQGYKPLSIKTEAEVQLDKTEEGFSISTITLNTRAEVPDVNSDTFNKIAEQAKSACPVSRALAGVEIRLKTDLQSGE